MITWNISYTNIESWLNEIKSQASPQIKTFLIGNKADLEDDRQVQMEEVEQFLAAHKFNYFIETSAKTGFNAQEVLIRAAKELYMAQLEYKDRSSKDGPVIPSQAPNQKDMNENINFAVNNEDKSRKKKGCY